MIMTDNTRSNCQHLVECLLIFCMFFVLQCGRSDLEPILALPALLSARMEHLGR